MSEEEGKEGGAPKAIIIGIIVVVVAVVVFVVTSKKSDYVPTGPGVNSIDFTLPDLDGKEHTLSDYRGKVVFLNFWATWCAPCKEEMPSMQVLYETFKNRGLEIIAVSIDKDGAEGVKEFVEAYGLTFTVLHDPRGKVKEKYKTTGVPETFIVDQNGVIAEKVWGTRQWEDAYSIRTILDLLDNGPRAPEAYREARSKKR